MTFKDIHSEPLIETWLNEKKSVKFFENMLEGVTEESFNRYKSLLKNDGRKAMQAFIKRKERYFLAEAKERARMQMMFENELFLLSEGYTGIVGIDEAGRGPLAGPVVAAVVMINPYDEWDGINDSKQLTEEKRNYFFERIKKEALTYGIGIASHFEIDDINILNATKLAMKRAIAMANEKCAIDYLLIDAVQLDDIPIKQLSLIKGDERSASIAAASILAKVTRDQIMETLENEYPGYGFAKHKGYGTKTHYEALNEKGASPVHRESFIKKWREQKASGLCD
jgi:ribonuclease HII